MKEEETIRYSNKDYKRLGDRIRKDPDNISDEDLRVLQQLRLTYKEPLAVIFTAIEKSAHKVDPNCICTYRVKRIESIVSKLLRFPEMQVNRAEDIAGCRCILSSTEKVYKLYEKLMKNQDRLPFEFQGRIHDYIAEPKESGYRSIHLNAVLKGGDNRRIEIQLRSLEHHNWATLVEITDLLFQSRLKEFGRKGNSDLFDLHRLLAKERDEMTPGDCYQIADTAIQYHYMDRLGEVFTRNYLDVRRQWNKMKLQNYHFFLIATDSEGVPDFSGFLGFEEAERAYFDRFTNNTGNLNIVLTHLQKAGFTKISVAYSNYFLTFNNTLMRILLYLSEAVVMSYHQHRLRQFRRYYQAYLDIVRFWNEKQGLELDSFRHDSYIKRSILNEMEWSTSIKDEVNAFRTITIQMHRRLGFSLTGIVPYIVMKRMQSRFKQEMQEHEENL